MPDERRWRVGGRHQAFLLRVAHDPGCFPEPLGLLAPRRHRQVVDFAQVLDHRRQQSIPRRSGQRRLLAQQLDLAFPRQVEYGPRQLVEVEPKQFALAPFRADRLRVFRQPRASRRFRSRRSSTGRTFVSHIGPMVAEGSNRPVAMPAGFFSCGPARICMRRRGRLPIQVLKVTVEAGIPAAPRRSSGSASGNRRRRSSAPGSRTGAGRSDRGRRRRRDRRRLGGERQDRSSLTPTRRSVPSTSRQRAGCLPRRERRSRSGSTRSPRRSAIRGRPRRRCAQ